MLIQDFKTSDEIMFSKEWNYVEIIKCRYVEKIKNSPK